MIASFAINQFKGKKSAEFFKINHEPQASVDR